MKQKKIYNKERSEQKKVFRTHTAPATKWHKDKSKYTRTQKYKARYV